MSRVLTHSCCNTLNVNNFEMSISTFNFQFYNYKLPSGLPIMPATSFSELEMDIDEEMTTPSITSTPLPASKQQLTVTPTPTPRYTSEVCLELTPSTGNETPALRPLLHKPQKRWSMELREKVLEMSKHNNGSDGEESTLTPSTNVSQRFVQQLEQNCNETVSSNNSGSDAVAAEVTRSVSDKINFFNKLTNTYESAADKNSNSNNPNNNNRFISLLRSTQSTVRATTNSSNTAGGQMAPPKPKRLSAFSSADVSQHQFVTPTVSSTTLQRKTSIRRKPSMDKSRATITRQNSNSNASLRPQRHAMMEDLSLVVPVRLRIAEYEKRISMSA